MKYLVAIITILFAFFSASSASAKVDGSDKTVLLLNQVRGGECCEVGSPGVVRDQIETLQSLELPATFLLRYDAMTDDYKQLFEGKSELEVGAFLEITPSLVSDAKVAYKGPVARWYKAENAYLLGYQPSDRFKIIDTLMARFKSQFGSYPKTTAGWMLDSQSLKYLVEKYGITTHEITRDQWGTDSYTLYGGLVGPSYLPSKNWPLLPATTRTGALPVVMVRQTISDPVWNYGDSASVFTSQPNDYMKGGKDAEYFKKLLQQSLSQQPQGLAVVGLESTMPKKYQDEFVLQLREIARLRDMGEASVELPGVWSLKRLAQENRVSTYQGKDGSITAVWVNTSAYRLRFIFDTQKHKAFLDDVRLYGDDLTDPYALSIPVTPNAYWVAPFTIDGSRFSVRQAQTTGEKIRKFITSKLNIFDPCKTAAEVMYDACLEPEGIRLPAIGREQSLWVQKDSISYEDEAGGKVELKFNSGNFSISVPNPNEVSFIPKNPTTQALMKSELFGLKHEWKENTAVFTPEINEGVTLSQIQTTYPQAFIPEVAGGEASLAHSIIVAATPIVQLQRNPIRIVIYLRDAGGRVATPGAVPVVSLVEDPILSPTVEHPETSLGEYYFDLSPASAGWYTPKIMLGPDSRELPKVLVIPNCLRSLECLKRPGYFVKWLEMLVRDRIGH